MNKLSTSVYNRDLKKNEAKLKLWRYAGLMVTYKCSAACEFCYYRCAPDKNGLMTVKTALNAWKGLIQLAGSNAKVHITGGEPFLFFDRVLQIATEAKKAGFGPLDTIETNGQWANNRNDIIEKLSLLKEAGMQRLKISWDAFHAQFVDRDRVKQLAETAQEVLGSNGVLVRWKKYLDNNIIDMESKDKDQLYRKAIQDYPCRFTGRAAGRIAELAANKTIDQVAKSSCRSAFLSAKGVHVDPYGNVFSGLCSGIIVGNVSEKTLADIWTDFDPPKYRFISALFADSKKQLLDEAVALGYKIKSCYADKCHLCTDIRQFFFDRNKYQPIIGPGDCYVI